MSSLCCPLCGSGAVLFHRDHFREYWRCSRCFLTFVPSQFHVSSEDEKALYDLHQNSPYDAGYLHFLSRLTVPLACRLSVPSRGLDFGCGPGPALASVLEKQGHTVVEYDPYYCDDSSLLAGRYDFICATEVVEHFKAPGDEFDRLFQMLNKDGYLALMTKLVHEAEAFKVWHYIRDPTHIAFYSRQTFFWIAGKYAADIEIVGNDVIFFHTKY